MMDGATTEKDNARVKIRGGQLPRDSWVKAARDIFIDGGIGALGVRGLAASLGVTPGAFYWQFRSLDDLHDELRNDWARSNTLPFEQAIASAGPDGMQQYLAWVRVLIEETAFCPEYDNVMRDWARVSPATADILHQTEAMRIAQLRGVFQALGYDGQAAEIRARVSYYHQAGYIAMRIRESLHDRLANIPYYADVLTGRDSRRLVAASEWVQNLLGKVSES
jgi:AcrR family transcriptional regulator